MLLMYCFVTKKTSSVVNSLFKSKPIAFLRATLKLDYASIKDCAIVYGYRNLSFKDSYKKFFVEAELKFSL